MAMSKINKALDLNKLKDAQAQGKLLKKKLSFPLMATIKFDGNYTVTEIKDGKITHYTSGGLTYTHSDEGAKCFENADDGYYLAERIARKGKLGTRRYCSLTGPKIAQIATNHTYKVFDYLTPEEYTKGFSSVPYSIRYSALKNTGVSLDSIVQMLYINREDELNITLKDVVNEGYEGLMLANPLWKWTDTTSRKIEFCKLKKRKTVDLLCIGTTEGEGKYEGMIGSLILRDRQGREVKVGSGLSDEQRKCHPAAFKGLVIEIEYEQIIDTYIQPTYTGIRHDKHAGDID